MLEVMNSTDVIIIGGLVGLGLCLGSFVNALVWRLHKQSRAKKKTDQYSIVHGRSMCSSCKHPLAASDLVPVLSWLWLRGRCRYCKAPIPDTPLPEVLMPLLLIVSYYTWPSLYGLWTVWTITLFAVWVLILTCFVALSLYDARWFLLPDRVVLPLTILCIVFTILCIVIKADYRVGVWAAVGATTIAGLFYAIEKLSRGAWIGHGDVKLGISLGTVAGSVWPALLVVFVASVLGSMYLVLALLFGGMQRNKTPLMRREIPFGPFLIAATFLVVLWGQSLIGWYKNLLLL